MKPKLLDKIIENADIQLKKDKHVRAPLGGHAEITRETRTCLAECWTDIPTSVGGSNSSVLTYKPGSYDEYWSHFQRYIDRHAYILDKEGRILTRVKEECHRSIFHDIADKDILETIQGKSERVEEALQKTPRRKARYILIEQHEEERLFYNRGDRGYNPEPPTGFIVYDHFVLVVPLELAEEDEASRRCLRS